MADSKFSVWNRRLHYYLGLYFLLFIWLFALTGLLLNHAWSFAEFWPNRKVTNSEHAIEPRAGSMLEQAQGVMSQLGIAGEIQWITAKPDATRLDFRVTRPGRQYEIKADWPQRRATVQRTDVNVWGTTRTLHTFTGVRFNDAANERDWLLTRIWAYSMDAVAIGLIVMVLSGIGLWLAAPARRVAGLVALGTGIAIAGWFVFALRWIYG